jgi:hypothetical protein
VAVQDTRCTGIRDGREAAVYITEHSNVLEVML